MYYVLVLYSINGYAIGPKYYIYTYIAHLISSPSIFGSILRYKQHKNLEPGKEYLNITYIYSRAELTHIFNFY
jgi:hypothetical protein